MLGLLQFSAPFYHQASDTSGWASKPVFPLSSPIRPGPPASVKRFFSCLLLNSRDFLVIFEERGRGRVFLARMDCQVEGWKTPRVNSHCPSSQTSLFSPALSGAPRVSSKVWVSVGSVSPLQTPWEPAPIFHAGSRWPFPSPCVVTSHTRLALQFPHPQQDVD